MKIDRTTKLLLGLIAVLLFLNFMNNFLGSKPALAALEGGENRGKYQISAWAVQAQSADPRSGYYVLDTTTGMVVASKTEVHVR